MSGAARKARKRVGESFVPKPPKEPTPPILRSGNRHDRERFASQVADEVFAQPKPDSWEHATPEQIIADIRAAKKREHDLYLAGYRGTNPEPPQPDSEVTGASSGGDRVEDSKGS